MKTKRDIAAEAYQVIGALASSAGLFDDKEVQRALDYFSAVANGENPEEAILPWGVTTRKVMTFEDWKNAMR